MVKLDGLDKKILSLIQDDARASFAKIAHKLGVSEGTIHLRVRKMQKRDVIKGFYTIVSPEKLGKGLTAFITVKADPAKYPGVLQSLLEIADISEIHDVTGEFYAMLKVRTKDKESLAGVIDKVGTVKGVTATQTMVVLRTVKEQYNIEVK